MQIVSAIQACHWFDLPAFFKEVGRVLCNNGVVALAGYDVPTIVHPTKSEQLTEHLKSVGTSNYTKARIHIDSGF